MNVDRYVHIFAGTLILASLILSQVHSGYWLWLTAFVGANLLQSGITNWCLMSRILAAAGVNADGACGVKRT